MKKGLNNKETNEMYNTILNISNDNGSSYDMKSNTNENGNGKKKDNKKRNDINNNQCGNHHIDNNKSW